MECSHSAAETYLTARDVQPVAYCRTCGLWLRNGEALSADECERLLLDSTGRTVPEPGPGQRDA
jgi:hypothetical protein